MIDNVGYVTKKVLWYLSEAFSAAADENISLSMADGRITVKGLAGRYHWQIDEKSKSLYMIAGEAYNAYFGYLEAKMKKAKEKAEKAQSA